MFTSPRQLLRERVRLPQAPIPEGAMVRLGDRGETFVTDTPGPEPEAPTLVLLHALACTGLLTWYPSIPVLARRYRVVTLDQRCHGRGIATEDFSLADCADDVAALLDVLGLERALVAGYSMGSVVAQRVWRQHPDRVAGLVLAATTDRFRSTATERLFHASMELAVSGVRAVATAPGTPNVGAGTTLGTGSIHDWALDEFRSTRPRAVAEAVAALSRHHSRPWLGTIDVPTAVVATRNDKVIPVARQVDLAHRIPGATLHDIDAGHAACVLEAEAFVPAFSQAVNTVNARAQELSRRRP